MKPVAPDVRRGICKDGPCPVCPPGQSPGKNNSCVSAPLAKGTPVPQKGPTTPQACPAGQVWNGVQCALIGAQQCLPGQITVGSSCHVDCTLSTAGAQTYIELLRMARQEKDEACVGNSTTQKCRDAESTYEIRLLEYRSLLAGVPAECGLPDPIAI